MLLQCSVVMSFSDVVVNPEQIYLNGWLFVVFICILCIFNMTLLVCAIVKVIRLKILRCKAKKASQKQKEARLNQEAKLERQDGQNSSTRVKLLSNNDSTQNFPQRTEALVKSKNQLAKNRKKTLKGTSGGISTTKKTKIGKNGGKSTKQKQQEKDLLQSNVFDPESRSLSDQSPVNFLRDFRTRPIVNPIPLQVRPDF